MNIKIRSQTKPAVATAEGNPSASKIKPAVANAEGEPEAPATASPQSEFKSASKTNRELKNNLTYSPREHYRKKAPATRKPITNSNNKKTPESATDSPTPSVQVLSTTSRLRTSPRQIVGHAPRDKTH
jgi:hypothetical protein